MRVLRLADRYLYDELETKASGSISDLFEEDTWLVRRPCLLEEFASMYNIFLGEFPEKQGPAFASCLESLSGWVSENFELLKCYKSFGDLLYMHGDLAFSVCDKINDKFCHKRDTLRKVLDRRDRRRMGSDGSSSATE